MHHRSGRLLTILQKLRERRRPVTARELAVTFAVSVRTIYRDVETLKGLGADIRGAPGIGFVLGPGYFLPPLSLSALEADALLLGLRFVSKRADPELADAANATIAKIADILDSDKELAMRMNGLAVGPSGSEDKSNIGWLRKAMEQERKVGFHYSDRDSAESNRVVWPTAVGFFDQVEILAAWCESREAFRHFRLDRISSLDVLADRMPIPRRTLLARYRLEEPAADI